MCFKDKNLGSGNHTAGIVLVYPHGDSCPHADSDNYQLTIALRCDEGK